MRYRVVTENSDPLFISFQMPYQPAYRANIWAYLPKCMCLDRPYLPGTDRGTLGCPVEFTSLHDVCYTCPKIGLHVTYFYSHFGT
jgi:hypothetical protein